MGEDGLSLKFRNFIENLKRLYGDYYFPKMTQEERDRYIDFYSRFFNKTIQEATEYVKRMTKSQKSSYLLASYNNFKNALIERYGEFYFVRMSLEEKSILVEHYYKAMQGLGEKLTKEEAFDKLYEMEYQLYESRMQDYANHLDNLELIYGKNK